MGASGGTDNNLADHLVKSPDILGEIGGWERFDDFTNVGEGATGSCYL